MVWSTRLECAAGGAHSSRFTTRVPPIDNHLPSSHLHRVAPLPRPPVPSPDPKPKARTSPDRHLENETVDALPDSLGHLPRFQLKAELHLPITSLELP